MLQIFCQKYVEPHRAALVFALEAPFATLFAFLFVAEKITFIEFMGAALIFLASILPEKWLSKKNGAL
jgi:drug/metabolite transporter (DMT)-like permease